MIIELKKLRLFLCLFALAFCFALYFFISGISVIEFVIIQTIYLHLF